MANYFVIVDGLTENTGETFHFQPFLYDKLKNCKDGFFNNEVKLLPIDSLSCISTLLGNPSSVIPTGRAYLEGQARGVPLQRNDIVFRCNLVGWWQERLETYNGQGLSYGVMEEIYQTIAEELSSNQITLYPLGGYRGLLVYRGGKEGCFISEQYAPHENLHGDKTFLEHHKFFPKDLVEFLQCSDAIIQNKLSKEKYSYGLYLWSMGKQSLYPSFLQLHNKSSIMITATPIVQGIAQAMEMAVATSMNCTGDVDTNLESKLFQAIENGDCYDVVFIHINGMDEAAHRRNYIEKTQFWDSIQRKFLMPMVNQMKKGDRLLVCTDHSTNSVTGKHIGGLQPFLLYTPEYTKKENLGSMPGIGAVKLLFEM